MIIGITGKAGAGKDTLATSLVSALSLAGHSASRFSYADAVKLVASIVACEPPENFYTREGKEGACDTLPMTRRALLHSVGQGLRETMWPTVWQDILMRDIRSAPCDFAIVSDVRYDSEAIALRAAGAVIVRIEREGSGLRGPEGLHPSEVPLSEGLVDFTVLNNGSLEALDLLAVDVARFAESRWGGNR